MNQTNKAIAATIHPKEASDVSCMNVAGSFRSFVNTMNNGMPSTTATTMHITNNGIIIQEGIPS